MKEVTLFKEDSYKNQKQMEKKKVVEQYSMREQEERKKEVPYTQEISYNE